MTMVLKAALVVSRSCFADLEFDSTSMMFRFFVTCPTYFWYVFYRSWDKKKKPFWVTHEFEGLNSLTQSHLMLDAHLSPQNQQQHIAHYCKYLGEAQVSEGFYTRSIFSNLCFESCSCARAGQHKFVTVPHAEVNANSAN